jgi:hypothetical protein
MYRLLFEDRFLSREPFVTREPLVFIGREAACTLRLVENGVSDRHAVIERREDGYYARDLGSANGVRVNGQKVDNQRLVSGDELEVGSVRLRFEIVHEPPSRRRSFDWLQALAAAVVACTILGQVVLLGRMFSESRPRYVRTDAGRMPSQPQGLPTISSNAAAPLAGSPSVAPLEPVTPVPSSRPMAPTVLNRRIRIQRVDRKDDSDGVTLQLRVVAQVGERKLDAAVVAIGIQFVAAGEGKMVWVTVPADWENFAPKTFAARCSGPPGQLRGYIVRTYYRKELQDVLSVPADLATTVPSPP